MEKNEFTKELLKIAFAATICDGNIDESELNTIRRIEREDYYFRDYALHQELESMIQAASFDFSNFVNSALRNISSLDLSPAQKIIMINLCIGIIRADGKMQPDEISFIKSLSLNLQLSHEFVEATNGKWWLLDYKAS
jgi:uncharacterized tellurite resistance protein B-like protein